MTTTLSPSLSPLPQSWLQKGNKLRGEEKKKQQRRKSDERQVVVGEGGVKQTEGKMRRRKRRSPHMTVAVFLLVLAKDTCV